MHFMKNYLFQLFQIKLIRNFARVNYFHVNSIVVTVCSFSLIISVIMYIPLTLPT